MAESEQLIRVDIVALVEDEPRGGPIVILHDRRGNRLLPIWIGNPEARAIAIVLNNTKTPRPLTHTLLLSIVNTLGCKLSRVVVDRIANNTYFACIYITTAASQDLKIDSRPSDAIALALEARAPIFVDKKVMDKVAQDNPFPGIAMRQEKREMKPEDLEKMQELLEKARQREQQASGE